MRTDTGRGPYSHGTLHAHHHTGEGTRCALTPALPPPGYGQPTRCRLSGRDTSGGLPQSRQGAQGSGPQVHARSGTRKTKNVSTCWETKGCGSPPPLDEHDAPPVGGEVGKVGVLGGVQIKVVPRPPAPVPAAGGPTDKNERRGAGRQARTSTKKSTEQGFLSRVLEYAAKRGSGLLQTVLNSFPSQSPGLKMQLSASSS
jgi:hypothetical protein